MNMPQAAEKTSPNALNAASFGGNNTTPTELTQMKAEDRQDFLCACNPATLRYLSAIRGYVPADQTEGFTYAMIGCGAGDFLTAMAAANPEGVFFGFDSDAAALETAAANAATFRVENVKFVHADADALSEAVKSGALHPSFDYVIANLSETPDKITATIKAAQSMLGAGGICYVTYPSGVMAMSPETFYVSYKPNTTYIDTAFSAIDGLTYLGSGKIRNNYIELTVPADQHEALLNHQDKPGYENLKTAVQGTTMRHDVWCKPGLTQNASDIVRLQSCVFGVTSPSAKINPSYRYFDKKIDLATPMFTRLIACLSDMPHTIGDMVTMEDMAGASQAEIATAIQMLVAIGQVEPVRTTHTMGKGNYEHMMLATSYNQRLRDHDINPQGMFLAAPTIGRPLLATAPMSMTLKALDQGGLKGAEPVLEALLENAPDAVKSMFPAGMLDTKETRLNTAYAMLQDSAREWLLFCCVQGILAPQDASI